MEWISVKEKKPDHDCDCLVINERGCLYPLKCRYVKKKDIFLFWQPLDKFNVTLDATHYIKIPKAEEKHNEENLSNLSKNIHDSISTCEGTTSLNLKNFKAGFSEVTENQQDN